VLYCSYIPQYYKEISSKRTHSV